MNPSAWQMAKQIFDEARCIAPEERQAFLERRCAGDAELRGEVEKLLGSYESDFLEETALDAAEALVKPSLNDGQIIGRYKIGKLIGSGGMGQVFRAEDTELGRPVAFKVLHHDVGADDERLRRFVQEARAASALNHPNILTIHEIGSFEGFRFIVSEFVDGETLRERMRRGLTTEQSVEVTCQIAAALKAAHSAGIVHRDIKPENVMLRGDGLVKVLDFGLAKLTEADEQPIDPNAPPSAVHTSPGLVMGTAAYMSPEKARGQAVDARTDLWSLGVVLHEMLTGTSPFEGETVTQLINSILKTDTSDALASNLPPELQPICRKALAKDKDSRYRSAHDLLKDLEGEKKRMEYSFQPTRYISVSSTDEMNTQLIRPRPTLSAEYIASSVKRHKYATFSAVSVVMFLAIGLSVYKFSGAPTSDQSSSMAAIGPTTAETDLTISRIPSSGKIIEIAISPDGKQIAYVSEVGSTKLGIRLLELETSRDTELVPAPAAEDYDDLSFSPDGKYLYYVLFGDKEDIYRVPTAGGKATKLVEKTSCGAGISPDGKAIAFQRKDKADILSIADPDGTNERILARAPFDGPDRFGCSGVPRWSPDGKEIVCWSNHTERNIRWNKLFAFRVADGSRRQISEKLWADVHSAEYMPDGSLLVSAREQALAERHLWLVTPNAEPRRITTAPNSYSMISTTRNGNTVVALQSSVRRDLWILPDNDVAQARQVTSSGEIVAGFGWMANGKIVYSSAITGRAEIWSMDNDGANRKRLTADHGQNARPVATRDGKYLLFDSNKADNRHHIIRTDPDGGNLKQLTNGYQELWPRPSPDGKWVYFVQMEEKLPVSIRKVSIDGGDPTVLATAAENTNFVSGGLDISNDGRVAYLVVQRLLGEKNETVGWKRTVFLVSSEGKGITNFDLPKSAEGSFIQWTPDGTAIAFNDHRDGSGDVWTIQVKGKPEPKRLTWFRTPRTNNFHWTIDGKQLLVSRAATTDDAVIIRRNN